MFIRFTLVMLSSCDSEDFPINLPTTEKNSFCALLSVAKLYIALHRFAQLDLDPNMKRKFDLKCQNAKNAKENTNTIMNASKCFKLYSRRHTNRTNIPCHCQSGNFCAQRTQQNPDPSPRPTHSRTDSQKHKTQETHAKTQEKNTKKKTSLVRSRIRRGTSTGKKVRKTHRWTKNKKKQWQNWSQLKRAKTCEGAWLSFFSVIMVTPLFRYPPSSYGWPFHQKRFFFSIYMWEFGPRTYFGSLSIYFAFLISLSRFTSF